MPPFSLTSTIRKYPDFPYEKMKKDILGSRYQLSLSFVGPARARALNRQYRHKDYVPNVLSFPLAPNCGEIVICPEIAYPEAKDFSLSSEGYIAFLFIHGALHLKGHDHGATMEKLERHYVKKYRVV